MPFSIFLLLLLLLHFLSRESRHGEDLGVKFLLQKHFKYLGLGDTKKV